MRKRYGSREATVSPSEVAIMYSSLKAPSAKEVTLCKVTFGGDVELLSGELFDDRSIQVHGPAGDGAPQIRSSVEGVLKRRVGEFLRVGTRKMWI